MEQTDEMKAKEREEGIKAIIYLQRTVGKTESPEKAGRSWDNFKSWEKQQTMAAYALVSKRLGIK